jgi:perosamine synthetase
VDRRNGSPQSPDMIPVSEPLLGEEELDNIVDALKSGWISSKGRFISEFEHGFAQYCGVKHGTATSNGTVALHLALSALGIGPGDEVIVPTLTFVATANAVRYTGARPVFVDSHPDYWCIDPAKVEEAVTANTKAIVPVHLYGHPCDMDAIMETAKRRRLLVIEDAAEAHGAQYKGKKVGSFGDVACFSFFGNKILTTGEGGMCLTDNAELAQKMRILKDHGMNPDKRYWHDVVGFNYRMTNMQAAVGVAQLEKVDRLVEKKRQIADWYAEELKPLEQRGLVKPPPEMPWATAVYWMYSVLIEAGFGVQRDTLIQELAKGGIETRPLFYPIHTMPPYEKSETFPVAEALSGKGISLPSGMRLTRENVETIASYLRRMGQ